VDLTEENTPLDFLKLFFGEAVYKVLVDNTGAYAWQQTAGAPGSRYAGTFHAITKGDIKNILALYLRNGLSPVPDMDLWFCDPSNNAVYGDDRVRRAWPGGSRRFKQIETFLHISSPFTPSHRGNLTKLEPLMSMIKKRSMEMWEAGAKGSIDEQTIGFQGRCKLKTRIKYKVEGDGFQCDAYCDSGYTYSWFFRFEKLTPVDDSFSPLHNRTLMLLSTLRADYTKV
jgi:hypothetical protein